MSEEELRRIGGFCRNARQRVDIPAAAYVGDVEALLIEVQRLRTENERLSGIVAVRGMTTLAAENACLRKENEWLQGVRETLNEELDEQRHSVAQMERKLQALDPAVKG